MLRIDDILPLIGTPLDERSIARLFGERGQRFSSELDPGHPEDQRHYYGVPTHDVEMILGDGETIDTIFFYLRGTQAGHAWSLRNGLSRSSSRRAVLAAMGTPERSGKPEPSGAPGRVGFDRFRVGHALLHFEYETDGAGIKMITAMSPATAPG